MTHSLEEKYLEPFFLSDMILCRVREQSRSKTNQRVISNLDMSSS
jgi:hypothetical protein